MARGPRTGERPASRRSTPAASRATIAVGVVTAIAGPDISAAAVAEQAAAMGRITGPALRRAVDCLVTHDLRGQPGPRSPRPRSS